MTKIDDGGPAFPGERMEGLRNMLTGALDFQKVQYPGMTLRDWFAGQFLAGAAVGDYPVYAADGESPEAALARYWAGIAAVAYSTADAMLATRQGGEQ